MAPPAQLLGQQFGRLTVIASAGSRDNNRMWLCRCECGNTRTHPTQYLTGGEVKSCGCLNRDRSRERHYTHHGTSKPEYWVWRQMRQRCHNPNRMSYPNYGGRGITVCDRWRHDFPAFYADMGPRPTPQHMIERTNNNGPYSPDNCVWATRLVQSNNKRNSRKLTLHGDTKTLAEWARHTGISTAKISGRIDKLKWPVERALTTP